MRRRHPAYTVSHVHHYAASTFQPGLAVVLVWCPACERWIGNEERHLCVLPVNITHIRTAERRYKQRQILGAAS